MMRLIEKIKSGYVSSEHIEASGFKVDSERSFSDMGQMIVTMKDYSKDDKLFLTGGYWHWQIKNKEGTLLWEGWPTSNEEFDSVISTLSQ